MSMPSTFAGLSSLGQIAMNAPDVERAKRFYRDTLGLPFLFEVPGMAFLDVGGIRLMLAKAESPEDDRPGSILYFRVPDIDDAHTALVDRGVAFEAPPHLAADMGDHELWMAFFRDSEANLLALMSEKPT